MKLFKYFLTLSRGKQIAIAVCTVHLFAIFALMCHHFISKQFKPAKNMIVRTVIPKTERKIQTPAASTPQKTAAAPRPQTIAPPAPKTQTPTPASTKPKAVASSKKPAPVKAAPKKESVVKDERLLKEIAESLETLSTESKQTKASLALPTKIAPKSERTTEETASYGEFLIGYLQTALDLPEYGEVKARLGIDRFGRLIDCEILEAKSIKNAQFLKNQLPQLTFPCLNDFGIRDATQQFNITFRNVEIH